MKRYVEKSFCIYYEKEKVLLKQAIRQVERLKGMETSKSKGINILTSKCHFRNSFTIFALLPRVTILAWEVNVPQQQLNCL